MTRYELGIDAGGTFIDVVCRDTETGEVTTAKGLISSSDPTRAVVDTLASLSSAKGLTLRHLLTATGLIVHGTTVGTNVLVTGRGARTALLTTEGFRDVLAMRRGVRVEPMNSHADQPLPLVPRRLRIGVRERVASDGSVRMPLARAEIDRVTGLLAAADVDAVAICLMFGFLNPSHERMLSEAVQRALPDAHVSVASDLLPQVRFFERTSTTVVDAAIAPEVSHYIGSLRSELATSGFGGRLLIVQSDGGVCTAEAAQRAPVRLVLSGPASGVTASARLCQRYRVRRAINADMGGTSFDVCLVTAGDPDVAHGRQVSGHEVALAMTAIHTIGAGGGSVVGTDGRGLLRIGPESAGADPGPICYGRGGERPTITDASVVLGYLDPGRFWGGRLQLDVERARQGIVESVADGAGESAEQAAWAVYCMANESMADAMREVTLRRGHDMRECAIVAVGGAAPLHMASVATDLEVPLVIVPGLGPVYCAAGALDGDLRFEAAQTYHAELAPGRMRDLERALERAGERAEAIVRGQASDGLPAFSLEFSVDMRYVGQFREVRVPVPDARITGDGGAALLAEFHRRHGSINGYSDHAGAVETVTVRAIAVARRHESVGPRRVIEARLSAVPGGRREIHWDGERVDSAVYGLASLDAGDCVAGPAIIDAAHTVTLVPFGWQGTIDADATILLTHAGSDAAAILEQLGQRDPAIASAVEYAGSA